MPISPIVLQRRQAELGRIRLGHKATTKSGKTYPEKLTAFRFTSPSEQYIRDLAELYGGEARPWDNSGKAEWEVLTTATSIPVIAIKGGLSQWMETWSGGGIVHRCTGEVDVTGNACDPDDPAHQEAKPTTRLSVMLPELEAIGAFRMETHGWHAAAEIPAVAELAQYVGDLVPAQLHLVERRAIKDGKTSRFVVPVLDLQIGAARLREIVNEKAGLELAAPSTAAAIEAPRPDYEAIAATLLDVASLQDLWRQAAEAGHLDGQLRERLTKRAEELKATAATTPAEAASSEPVEAEIVEEPATPQTTDSSDPDAIWQQILTATGRLGWSLEKTATDFRTVIGVIPDEASGEELAHYLHTVTTGEMEAS